MSLPERLMVNLSTALVAASGVTYAVMKYLLAPPAGDPFAVVNHPLQPWMLSAHVLSSPALIFAIGLIAQDHILTRYRNGNGTGRATGLLALLCLAPMIATGYLIQVFTHETARQACVVIHLTTGLIYVGLFIAHLAVTRRVAVSRRAASARGGTDGLVTAAWMRRQTPGLRPGAARRPRSGREPSTTGLP